VVAQVCDLSYLAGGDWEDCILRPVREKVRNNKAVKAGVVVRTCHPSSKGGVDRITV
jgi:hypothetical protein